MGEQGPFIVTRRDYGWHQAVVLAREAVADLEAARDWAYAAVGRVAGAEVHRFPFFTAADELPESGGKVSLPDGSEVEVEATTWERLMSEAGLHGPTPPTEGERAAILAAWRERHGVGGSVVSGEPVRTWTLVGEPCPTPLVPDAVDKVALGPALVDGQEVEVVAVRDVRQVLDGLGSCSFVVDTEADAAHERGYRQALALVADALGLEGGSDNEEGRFVDV